MLYSIIFAGIKYSDKIKINDEGYQAQTCGVG
jgi:hypothetical protein